MSLFTPNGNGDKAQLAALFDRVKRVETGLWSFVRTVGMAALLAWAGWQASTTLDNQDAIIGIGKDLDRALEILGDVKSEQGRRTALVYSIVDMQRRLDSLEVWRTSFGGPR
jgi:hypothetical protein